ncbi:MBL fold metallo-hydrolase [Pseudoalteromonas gelatinilytica]
MALRIHSFFHQQSATLCYLVSCENTKQCLLIDAPADFDMSSGELSFTTANEIISYIKTEQLTLQWLLETHAHADHITAASYIKQQLQDTHPCKLGTGEGITQVQQHFSQLYNLDMPCNGEPFDALFADKAQFQLGDYTVDVIATPGHTPDSVCFHIDGNVFVGDTFFMPDSGTARCDFPGGSASELYDSLQRILAFPDDTLLWMCHDYQPDGRPLANKTTVKEQREQNIHLKGDKQRFIETREGRDATLAVPKLLHPSIQLNIRAGQYPSKTDTQQHYLAIPLTVLL